MKLIDTHAHLFSKKFKGDLPEVIERSREAGIERIYMPNIDSTSIDDMLGLELKYPGYCIPMMGLHPCSVGKDFEKELYIVEDWLSKRDFVAVGEMGTDLYWEKAFFDQQKEAFSIQCDLAVKYDVPIVIHCRESMNETIDLVKAKNNNKLRGIFHCFTGDLDQASTIIELGFWLGIGGVSTFKNGGLEPVLEQVPLENLVLETDSPYLAPVPYRGKRNEPAYIQEIAQKIASITKNDIQKVAGTTTKTALEIFHPTNDKYEKI